MLDALTSESADRSDKRKSAEVYPFLETFIARKQQQINEILQVVERYEKKRSIEDQAYQTMSPLRRFISGRKPDHHLAVEYIHYVKKPLEQVSRLRAEIESAKALLLQSKSQDMVDVPDHLMKQMV